MSVDASTESGDLGAAGVIDSQPVAFPDVHVTGPSDQRDVGTRTREHAAEVATHGSGAHNRDTGPRRWIHAFSYREPAASLRSAANARRSIPDGS